MCSTHRHDFNMVPTWFLKASTIATDCGGKAREGGVARLCQGQKIEGSSSPLNSTRDEPAGPATSGHKGTAAEAVNDEHAASTPSVEMAIDLQKSRHWRRTQRMRASSVSGTSTRISLRNCSYVAACSQSHPDMSRKDGCKGLCMDGLSLPWMI
jgi:hypothetical protein